MKWYSRKSDEICSNIDLTPSSLPPACFFKLSQWELWKIEKSEFLLLQTFIRYRQYWLRLTFNLEKWSLQHKRSITSICLDAFKGLLIWRDVFLYQQNIKFDPYFVIFSYRSKIYRKMNTGGTKRFGYNSSEC